jgi:hypothetical protein
MIFRHLLRNILLRYNKQFLFYLPNFTARAQFEGGFRTPKNSPFENCSYQICWPVFCLQTESKILLPPFASYAIKDMNFLSLVVVMEITTEVKFLLLPWIHDHETCSENVR